MAPEEVAPGIFRLGNRTVNWWAIVTPQGLTLVDAGLRRHFSQLSELLRNSGRPMDDVKAFVLTGICYRCPGGPRVVHVPGPTKGSCALLLEEPSILFTVRDRGRATRSRLEVFD
jgi:glyoxylase-like metal-dependent hydrolase (beta-lactamase superfamily II)